MFIVTEYAALRSKGLLPACEIHILKPTSNWSPYIFTLVQKVKHRICKIHVCFFLSEELLCQDSASFFHLKMTCTSCTYEVREKVPSFQKVTIFLRYKPLHKLTFLSVWRCYWQAWYKKNKPQSFVSIGLVVFATQQHDTNTFSRLIIEIQL